MRLHDQYQHPASCEVPPVSFNSGMQVCRDEAKTTWRKQGHQDSSHGQSPVSIWQWRVLQRTTPRSSLAALYQYTFMSAKTTVTMAKMMGNLTGVHPSYPSSFRLHTINKQSLQESAASSMVNGQAEQRLQGNDQRSLLKAEAARNVCIAYEKRIAKRR